MARVPGEVLAWVFSRVLVKVFLLESWLELLLEPWYRTWAPPPTCPMPYIRAFPFSVLTTLWLPCVALAAITAAALARQFCKVYTLEPSHFLPLQHSWGKRFHSEEIILYVIFGDSEKSESEKSKRRVCSVLNWQAEEAGLFLCVFRASGERKERESGTHYSE